MMTKIKQTYIYKHLKDYSSAYIALLIAHLIWGVNFVVIKITVQEIPVMTILFLRFFLAVLLMLPFLLFIEKKDRKIKLDHLSTLFICGLFLIVLNNGFGYLGVSKTTAINAATLSLAIPLISVIVGWWFLREKIYLINLFGISLGFLGALFILGIPLIFTQGFQAEHMVGNILVVISGMFFVIGAVISKKILQSYNRLVFTTGVFTVGAVCFLIPAIIDYINNPKWVENVTIVGILGILYITILSTICAYFLLSWGLEKVGVIKTNLFHYIEPAIAATIAVPLLEERISYSFILGTCLVVLGVYWGTLGKSEHQHTHHKPHRI